MKVRSRDVCYEVIGNIKNSGDANMSSRRDSLCLQRHQTPKSSLYVKLEVPSVSEYKCA